MNKVFSVSVLLSLFISSSAFAQEPSAISAADASKVITIETTTLRGNQELPTVLYLVPWQPPKINPLPASQTSELSRQSLEKIERNSFQRLLEYHQMFKASRD